MAFKLTIEQGRGSGQSFEFDDEEITIGRTEENDIVLFDGGVSRQHCRIELVDGKYVVSDLESANGTVVNGKKAPSTELKDGDRIQVGPSTFRFEKLTGASKEGSTRIVSLDANGNPVDASKAGRATPNASARAGAGAAKADAGDGRRLPVPLLVGGGVVALLLVVVAAAQFGGGTDGGQESCPSALDPTLDGFRDLVFAAGEGDCDPGDALTLSFTQEPKTRVILRFAPFRTDKGEVTVELNGTKIGDSALAPTKKSVPQQITLADKLLVPDGENTIRFVSGSGDVWGVERIELEVIAATDADPVQATEAFRLGEARYKEKNVAARNLYDAWMYMRQARRHMEFLEPKPANYQAALDYIRDWEKELDKRCSQKLFEAEREATYDRIERANEQYEFLIAAFPGDAHPCRRKAQENMYVSTGGEAEE